MKSLGNRRSFLVGAAALGGCLLLPAGYAGAASWAPSRFSVQVVGSGPDVILVPGLASSREVWRAAVAAVPGYRYHLDQLGGFSGEPVRGNGSGRIVTGVAEELSRYIAARGLRRPAVIGHSMGGTIGMLLALDHPDQVGRLMVVDMLPQPSNMFGSTPDRIRPLVDNLRGLAQTPGGRELFASLLGLFGPQGDDASRSDPDVTGRAMHELATMDLSRNLSRLAVPATIVYASPARSQGAAMDRVFASAYRAAPRAKFVRIDDSGHLIMADQPAEFHKAVREFLEKGSG